MRLTVKLVIWFLLCAVLAVGINGFYGVRGELERYEADLAARHVLMGRVLREAFAEVMDTDGEARAVSMLAYTDKRVTVDIRWVHLDESAPEARKPKTSLSLLTGLRHDREVHDKVAGRLRTYVPMRIEGRDLTALEFSESLEGEQAVIRHAELRTLRSVGFMTLAIGIAAAFLGVVLVARPMRRLVEHARRIGRSDLSPMPPPRGKDEIAELGREMNAMCTRLAEAQSAKLKALEQLRHAERLSTAGKLASGLAHELGTPLNVITLRAKAIANGRAVGDRARDAATSIAQQATRMTSLVRHLLDFARRRTPQRDVVDVNDVLRRATDLVEPMANKAKARIDIHAASGRHKVRGDAGQLEQVVTNLVMNAIHAMPDGGQVEVSASLATMTPPADHGGTDAEFVRVSVRDTGVGIAEDVLPHIFEPFFTTKDVGDGTGLGLAVCYGIVRDHGGWIDVKSSRGDGSVFTFYLPEEQG
jgi:two-component system, NtrC family, sensor kinase